MPRNEDGEFELILGNRQLLSVFFIVVILLGVFFTMGYIVGRNSPAPMAAADTNGGKPMVVDSASRPTPSGSPVPPPAEPAATPAVETPKETTAEVPASTHASAPKEQAKAPEPVKPAKEEKPQSASPVPDQPGPGTYLQVVAIPRKEEAQLYVDVLAKKGFRAIYVTIPDKPDTFRILIGPFKDQPAVVQARNDLVKAGFKGFDAIQRKY